MKIFFADNYDKIFIILACSLLIIQIFSTDVDKFEQPRNATNFSQFKIINSSEGTFIEPIKDTSLLPGNSLYFKNLDDSDWDKFVVNSVHFSKRQNIVLHTTDDKKLEGTLANDITFDNDWRKSTESVAVRQKRDTIFIPVKKVGQITSRQRIKIPESLKGFDWSNHELSFFQRLNLLSGNEAQLPGKPKWTGTGIDGNSTKYDLFTPPIIYLDDGKLTARLPEKEKPQELQEPFGLKLKSSTKAPYFLKLSSWVGNVPYFEDKNAKLSENSSKFTRNRIEVGKFYKRDNNRKPGQPSLIECNESDPDRLLKVEHFVVQQHKNAKTGGLRLIGRSLVRDYILGGDPFEINSVMNSVYAGDYTFLFEFNLPDYDAQNIEISSKDEGRIISLSGRSYEVVKIDLKSNQITIVKKDPRILEDIEKSFKFTSP
jgi:hypothetical protein